MALDQASLNAFGAAFRPARWKRMEAYEMRQTFTREFLKQVVELLR
jgi:hypothetical protein